MSRAPAPALRYRVAVLDLHAHLFSVTLEIDRPAAVQKLALQVATLVA